MITTCRGFSTVPGATSTENRQARVPLRPTALVAGEKG